MQLLKQTRVSENFVKDKKDQIEKRIKQQLKELIPSLVSSAQILSAKASSPNSGTLTPEDAFTELKS